MDGFIGHASTNGNRSIKRVLLIGSTLAVVSCGGGGGGQAQTQPIRPDVFQRVAEESAAQSGLRFTHQYSDFKSDAFGNSESTAFNCSDISKKDEQALRSQATSSSENRVCFSSSSNSQTCEYPGTNSIREIVDSSSSSGSSQVDSVGLRVSGSNDSAIFIVARATSGSRLDLVGIVATERDQNCDKNNNPGFRAEDSNGVWSAASYRIDGNGVPVLELSGKFTCSGSSCNGSEGFQVSGISANAVDGNGLIYRGQSAIAGASYSSSRFVLSKSKRTLAMLACPSGVAASDIFRICKLLVASRQ